MSTKAGSKLKVLLKLQEQEAELSFVDAVGLDIEPTAQEASKLSAMRAKLRDCTDDVFEEESSESAGDADSSDTEVSSDGEEPSEADSVAGPEM
jgi:hypothetical protein